MTIYPQSVNTFPEIILILQDMLIYAFIHILSQNPLVCQDWGVGVLGKANFGNARILEPSVIATPPLFLLHV